MNLALLGVALMLAVGLWGYLNSGDVLYVVNRLSAKDIATVAANAGFSGDNLVTAVAIALAESSGDPQASGDSGTSYGLWQIHWTVHPEFDKDQLFDPQYNANAAYALYSRRGNFTDWSTFTVPDPRTGALAYAKYLDTAEQAVFG